ncbi:hypothetical protein DEM27_00215 [Metarhizobium album]|uniref:Uncharacterized protein n=1 Tax=Metarhizobium album TaxID=2182425 RepID=A0A2U2DWH2_9HYPH|nr:hypothetical protein [Rhizobium album]PWE57673.1 hypothetical protein DEM27_00215 [Rhizobium album]
MIIFPMPFIGRNTEYKGSITHVALATPLVGGAPVTTRTLEYRVSDGGLVYTRIIPGGDIVQYTQQGLPGELGAFNCTKAIVHGGKIYFVGWITDGASFQRAAVFVSPNGRDINRSKTPIDGVKGASFKRFVDGVSFGGQLVLLCSTGELAVTTNGDSWTSYADKGFAADAQSIAAGTGVLVGVGDGGAALSGASASAAWTARDLGFAGTDAQVVQGGNVLAAFGTGKIATAALNNPATWTLRTDPVGGVFDWVGYKSGRWFASGTGGKWLTSTDGTSYSSPVGKPMPGTERVRSGYWDGTRWLIFLSDGTLAISTNDTSWTRPGDTGLAGFSYYASAKLG